MGMAPGCVSSDTLPGRVESTMVANPTAVCCLWWGWWRVAAKSLCSRPGREEHWSPPDCAWHSPAIV